MKTSVKFRVYSVYSSWLKDVWFVAISQLSTNEASCLLASLMFRASKMECSVSLAGAKNVQERGRQKGCSVAHETASPVEVVYLCLPEFEGCLKLTIP